VRRNLGDGTFGEPVWLDAGPEAYTPVAADFDGDGNLDLAVRLGTPGCPAGSAGVRVFLGHGDGTFTATYDLSIGTYSSALAAADLDGDGRPDLVVVNDDDDTVTVLRNVGGGSFAFFLAEPGFATSDVVALVADDVRFWRNLGGGAFAAPVDFPAGLESMIVADLDGDGLPDVVGVNMPANVVRTLHNRGDGSFDTPVTMPVDVPPMNVAVADLDGDGQADLLVTSSGDEPMAVHWGRGLGTYDSPSYYLGAGPALAVGDLDRDGRTDLVLGSDWGPVEVLRNTCLP
jgi:hypothetical protein